MLKVTLNILVSTVQGTHDYYGTISYPASRFGASTKHVFQKPKLLINPTAELYARSVILFTNS
jgi:hypothetical protein